MFKTLLPLFLVPALLAAQAQAQAEDRRVLAMGTELSLHLEGAADLGRRSEAALAEVARVEVACSTWNPTTPWSRLGAAQGHPVRLDREWLDLLGRAKAWSLRTEGAFDPVLMALVRAWGLREGGRTPEARMLAAARLASGAALLDLDAEAGTARLRHPAAGVEEGGFLKGYTLDRMKVVVGTTSGHLDFGGQVLAWGAPLAVQIADPRDRERPRLAIVLENASLASSSTSERGRHLLDPRSGSPCPAWGSVAVVAADGFTADVLSTALYVMGPEAGFRWAERRAVAAAFLLNDGSVRMTRPLRAMSPTIPTLEPQ